MSAPEAGTTTPRGTLAALSFLHSKRFQLHLHIFREYERLVWHAAQG